MSGNDPEFSYIDSRGKAHGFDQYNQELIATFPPSKFDEARDLIKSLDLNEGKNVNEDRGFGRVKTHPGNQFNDAIAQLTSPKASDVITAVMPAVRERVQIKKSDTKYLNITRYFFPRQLSIKVKEQFQSNATNILASHNLTPVHHYGRGLYSITFQKASADSELQGLFAALMKYGMKIDSNNMISPAVSEFESVEPHEAGFDVGLLSPNDSRYNNLAWHFRPQLSTVHINVESAWNLTTGIQRVRVAVLDTGADIDHPDLVNQIIEHYNSMTLTDSLSAVDDTHGHGTEVAGAVGAQTGNSTGVAGTSWGCKLFIVKIMSNPTSMDFDDATAGIEEVTVRASNTSGPAGRRYVMNLSWECSNNIDILNAIEDAYNAGVVVVAAGADRNPPVDISGNVWPASWPYCIPVAGHRNANGAPIRSTSCYGSGCVIAPGENVDTTKRGNGYGNANGTSIAAALVSGTAALCWSESWNGSSFTTTRAGVYNAILNNTTPWSGSVPMRGRLNAFAAVDSII